MEIGLNTRDTTTDSKTGIIQKQVRTVPAFDGGFNDIPTKEDYERAVGESISFLTCPKWGISEKIPSCSFSVIESNKYVSGCECWIRMKFIKGQTLSELKSLPDKTAGQLTDFLHKCVAMAEITRKEIGFVVLPDLLGGVRYPNARLSNFIVEDGTNDLYFVDVYPLAELKGGRVERKYSKKLLETASSFSEEDIREALILLAKRVGGHK